MRGEDGKLGGVKKRSFLKMLNFASAINQISKKRRETP